MDCPKCGYDKHRVLITRRFQVFDIRECQCRDIKCSHIFYSFGIRIDTRLKKHIEELSETELADILKEWDNAGNN